MSTITLPKNALQRVNVGKAFAEYDIIRNNPDLFVSTPATLAALDPSNDSCFFVGRRGAGKTAIVYEIERRFRRTISITPQIFDLLQLPLDQAHFHDTRQRPFKSLMHAMERALIDEIIRKWCDDHIFDFRNTSDAIKRERNLIEDFEFDQRILYLAHEIFDAYSQHQDKTWLKMINKSKELTKSVIGYEADGNFRYNILIDRLDESWDGSESAIICLMALMHAVVRVRSTTICVRPYVFIRENIYDRLRTVDNEFARLETSVVFLDWSEPKLRELIERRLVRPFTAKPKLGGDAWNHFFDEMGDTGSIDAVMQLCQHRPRDILMLTSYAVDSAINDGNQKISKDNLHSASIRYSTSRLKDLGDEFAENYPNISLVLEYFYGLGTDYTLVAIEHFVQKLLVTESIKNYCKGWVYEYLPPYRFVELFYNIGFFGIRNRSDVQYKEPSKHSSAMPAIDMSSVIAIHPTYHSALNLRNILIPSLAEEVSLKNAGILEDLPGNFKLGEYKETLQRTLDRLKSLPVGPAACHKFEEIVGDIIRLCFFRSLTNVESKVRLQNGCTIRDWVASNTAKSGFWEVIRTKYGATQVVWECKNYDQLSSDDFQQVCYYMNDTLGHFAIIVYRGSSIENRYYDHISIASNRNRNGMILLLHQKDLEVFLRQAIHGVFKETHIQERFDSIVRKIG